MKTDKHRLEQIAKFGNELLEVIREDAITKDDILSNKRIQWLITTPLFNIGEQANCLSAEFVDNHWEMGWNRIAGLRHRLVHNYEGTNWEIIAEVVFEKLPILIEQTQAILNQLYEEENCLDKCDPK